MTARLEDLKPDALVKGLVGRESVRIVATEMLGGGRKWSLSGCGDLFRLVSEAT